MARKRNLDQDTVVAAAADLANEAGGPQHITLKQLAEVLNVRVPSLYNHIDGVEGLRRDLVLLSLTRLLEAMQQAAIGKAGRGALIAVAEGYRAFAQANPGLYPLVLAAVDPDDEALNAVSEQLVNLLALLVEGYGLTGDEAIHAIRGYRSVVHGFVSLEAAGGFGMPVDPEETFRRLVVTFLDGLGG